MAIYNFVIIKLENIPAVYYNSVYNTLVHGILFFFIMPVFLSQVLDVQIMTRIFTDWFFVVCLFEVHLTFWINSIKRQKTFWLRFRPYMLLNYPQFSILPLRAVCYT